MGRLFYLFAVGFSGLALGMAARAQAASVRFGFDEEVASSGASPVRAIADTAQQSKWEFVPGLSGAALRVSSGVRYPVEALPLDGSSDFSVEFWVRTTADSGRRMLLLSQKDSFVRNTLHAHRQPGWAFLMSNGTWAWNIGSGSRRLTYERDNGRIMPLNDGRWHQLVMTFRRRAAQVRLYFDGVERALYGLRDDAGFAFANPAPLAVGQAVHLADGDRGPTIEDGAESLSRFVQAFNDLGFTPLQPNELLDAVSEPQRYLTKRVLSGVDRDDPGAAIKLNATDCSAVLAIEKQLMRSPYTIHQSREFMEVSMLRRLYRLGRDGIEIDPRGRERVLDEERLDSPDFDLDELSIVPRVLTREEVRSSYSRHFTLPKGEQPESIEALTVAVWNIEHGGKHLTVDEHGWDSRVAIAELIEREGADIVLLQETYSSGDFLAAELGYHLAESVDWDYLNQGANLSVISRFPVQSLDVPPSASFSNIAVTLSLSQTQKICAMSNWYGMDKFAGVVEHHGPRLNQSEIPVLFGGDFNAVPHFDFNAMPQFAGGPSPASRKLSALGFVDAFRSLHPDAAKHPGFSHDSGRRIDQLYFKGSALMLRSTHVVSTWPTGFPSDHFMIVSKFAVRK